MTRLFRPLLTSAVCLLPWVQTAAAQAAPDPAGLAASLAELRHTIGRWDVTTEFLAPDGSVARSVTGTYAFAWVIPDRVASGQSDIPETGQRSAILFYLNEARGHIEMVSVGADGRLWTMTGSLGDSVRTTPPFGQGAGMSRLRFTRFNVTADRFESRMAVTTDDGATWTPANHQVFRRSADPSGGQS